ncbi:FecR domain-containing protein [Rhodopirellula sallentina]|uniref:FecR protein domain protein n=1 Tax=Rhodopirellula sallentina SM41 TaxID=1263870 RepID=M5UEF3_9BACT|nr:FecR domain-containing protein [Rhodopirellula sallentina]EMI54388.1 FecR protein domain protein [Rhodopirellula sallentina SM41]
MNNDRFEELLNKFFDDDAAEQDISEQEIAELHAAVTESQNRRARFQEASRVNVLLRETLLEQTEIQSLSQNYLPRRKPTRRQIASMAAAATLLLCTFVSFRLYQTVIGSGDIVGTCMSVSGGVEVFVIRDEKQHRATPGFELHDRDEVICDSQTQAMLRLTDGSIVSMEKNSALRMTDAPSKIKLLRGEAYFEIAPRDALMPAFEVLTGQSTIEVMGTVFSLIASQNTELKVYEGSVTLTRHRDKAQVEVKSQQMATSDDLSVQELGATSLDPIKVFPTDDLTLDRGEREKKFQWLKVEGKRRVTYLKFDIPDQREFRFAKLRLTQSVDSGSGTLRFHTGEHNQWNEADLTATTAPRPLKEVAVHRGVVARGQVVEVDVSEVAARPGPVTFIVTLDQAGEDDIWFGASESDTPPVLILH